MSEPSTPPSWAATDRVVLVVAHTGRDAAGTVAADFSRRLATAGLGVRVLAGEVPDVVAELGLGDVVAELGLGDVVAADDRAAQGCELVVVFGGDGTILRGAELARPSQVPLLGVNLGHVGFLAEADVDDIEVTVARVVQQTYEVEERLTIDVVVRVDGEVVHRDWALNDASVEKASRERMLEAVVEVDSRPVSRFGCDGIVCATPTGSTAYNFSAGGPVVWPEVRALLMVPISAHALFARPLVVSPDSMLAIEVLDRGDAQAVLWCDGRRTRTLPPGARVEVRAGQRPVRLARLQSAPFADRLVRKFELPVSGWRGSAEQRRET